MDKLKLKKQIQIHVNKQKKFPHKNKKIVCLKKHKKNKFPQKKIWSTLKQNSPNIKLMST